MPSFVRPASPQPSHVPSKKKFRTVLGLAAVFRDLDVDSGSSTSQQPPSEPAARSLTFTRQSFDTAASVNTGSTYRKHKRGRASIADAGFFTPAQSPTPIGAHFSPASQTSFIDITVDDMKPVDVNVAHARPANRRPPVRMDTQDGPWSISVAESPHNARSYCLYVKTPTHNLTLTRTAMEIVELDQKLRDSTPGVKLPPMPIDASTLPSQPKRKSTFLNTLSRLASPTRQSSRRMQNTSIIPSGLPTPLTSPSGEIGDPFSSFSSSTAQSRTGSIIEQPPAPSANSTAIAAYLTTVSNTLTVRQTRVWKRFVRVRTDDLESVRVERAIKRVRSDLAAHVHAPSGAKAASETQPLPIAAAYMHSTSSAPSEKASIIQDTVMEDDIASIAASTAPTQSDAHPDQNMDIDDATTGHGTEHATGGAPSPVALNGHVALAEEPITASSVHVDAPTTPAAEEEHPATPVATEPPSNPSRMHRSQSADPDKASRLSRAFAAGSASSTSISADHMSSSQEQSQTEDDSSVSVTEDRVKRKKSKKEKKDKGDVEKQQRKSRKVVIDDFEMMRVLGKGCAGKVLLVRHKSTQDLFALKAITKRHVLAHQELQHTLTEQAVLKRMAAENKDPFVVKLWWSFHDKENLFLVMDFHPGGDLATQLARWGRLGRDRARFYAAEIVEGVEGLHAAGVIYRDLKPENILIGSDGHIVLTDFGLSKEFPRRNSTTTTTTPSTPSGHRGATEFYNNGAATPATPPWMRQDPDAPAGELGVGWPGQPVGQSDSTSTFCGTAEYLAPEVIQGLPYSYEVDWWSFGTMLYEMLTGITPFWANNHSDMYVRVLQDELQFPDDRAIDQDTKSLIRGLLQRNPALRICEPRIKRHPYFSMIDWSHVYYKRYIREYILYWHGWLS
ncbi:hypothetical protein HGRIS_008601 [Hohenbuehelia grisea]|uniref:Protein kinase domain-containing protein n=1 Tax=Hohenbuehelia grisea TaxID=104357 RepID=A0ABR3J8H1_9AGAR